MEKSLLKKIGKDFFFALTRLRNLEDFPLKVYIETYFHADKRNINVNLTLINCKLKVIY